MWLNKNIELEEERKVRFIQINRGFWRTSYNEFKIKTDILRMEFILFWFDFQKIIKLLNVKPKLISNFASKERYRYFFLFPAKIL